jgi:hypothetical protein
MGVAVRPDPCGSPSYFARFPEDREKMREMSQVLQPALPQAVSAPVIPAAAKKALV